MRNLVKYFLALAVMGGGFYAAQQHRHPSGSPPPDTLAAREPADAASQGAKPVRPEPTSASSPLPVAALADVDRVPLVGSDRLSASAGAKPSETASVTHQPTLRAERSAAPQPAVDAIKKGDSPAAKPESSSSPQAEDKPKTKKQNPKKGATAEPQEKQQEKPQEKDKGKGQGETKVKDFVPPDLASEYRPRAERTEGGESSKETSSRPVDAPAAPDAASAKPAVAQARPKPKSRKTATETAPRRHRIAEGDTLARLAEKYLGSRDRYLDLFQANTEVLFDPRLIPIGVEIVIPDRTTVVAQAAPAPSADAARDADRPTGESTDAPAPDVGPSASP